MNFVHLSSVGRGKQQQQQQHPTEYLSSTENKSRKPDLKTMKSSKNQFVTLNEAKKLNPKEQDGAELPDGKNCCGVNFNKGGGHNHSAGNLYASLLEDIKSPEGEEFCPTCELPRDVDMCGVSDAETGA